MIWQRRCRSLGCPIGLLILAALSASALADTSSNSGEAIAHRSVVSLVLPADSVLQLPNITFDSLAVICGAGVLIPAGDYSLSDGEIRFVTDIRSCDSLKILLFPSAPRLGLSFRLRNFQSEQSRGPRQNHVTPQSAVTPTRLPTGKLQVSGTKTFYADVSDYSGTNLSQGLSLTLNGEVGAGITVRGSFSDQGLRSDRLVTKRFSQLENVYLEAESDKVRGRFGSFVLTQDQSRYLRLTRKIQGLQFGVTSGAVTSSASVGVPQGNFTANTFTTTDGNFGPYRLHDNNNVPGIAVVENSETVWLNGIRLERGRDRDYYVDYPRGELIFTGRRSIDDGDRVRVEFESVRLEYRKTVLALNNKITPHSGGISFGLGYVGLLESRTDPVDFELSQTDVSALQAAGDNPDNAIVPGAAFVGTGDGDYRLELNTDGDTVYAYAGQGNGDYRVRFTQFASGDYIYLGNGRYQYVGKGQGTYLPLRPLPLPARTQIASATAQYQGNSGLWGSVESAFSLQDKNLFSKINDANNASAAVEMQAGAKSQSTGRYAQVEAEYLPANFARLQRYEVVDENYLWQRSSNAVGDRQRYTARVGGGISQHDKSDLELGYTHEGNNFESMRLGWSGRIDSVANSAATWKLDLASATDNDIRNKLLRFQPQLRNSISPLEVNLAGDFDLRRQEQQGSGQTDSKREGELSIGYGGLTLSARQRENWRKQESWRLLDRKRTIRADVNRKFRSGNEISALLLWNRFDPGTGVWEDYQTGSFNAVLQRVVNFLSVSADYRLNRRGSSQTNQTYLRVADGEGDYVLVDSTYLPQERGDYILVTEQVGDLSQSTEAEKHARFDVEPGRISKFVLLKESSFRYEINFREIGSPEAQFASGWLAPPITYFDNDFRFRDIDRQYQWRRRVAKVGFRGEISARFHTTDNRLDVSHPRLQTSEEGRLLLNQAIKRRDNVQLELNWRNSDDKQTSVYSLSLRRRGGEVSATHFQGPWEYVLSFTGFREKADSLNLQALSLRLEPGLNYNLGELGRVETSLFVMSVTEKNHRELLIQMADNFPRGSHWGGRARVDVKLGHSFSFRLLGRAEMLSGRDNRYFLRTELVSRFQ